MWRRQELARHQQGLHVTSFNMELPAVTFEPDQRSSFFRNRALVGAFQSHRHLTLMSKVKRKSDFGLEHLVRNAWAMSGEAEAIEVSYPKALKDFLKEIREIKGSDYGVRKGPSIEELKGNIQEISKDFRGSRYLSFLLKQSPDKDVSIIYNEIIEDCDKLAIHQNAHYIIRDLFQELGEERQSILLQRMNVAKVTSHPVGNHVIQRAIVVLRAPLKAQLVSYLRGSVVELFKSVHASFALEKIIERVDTGSYWFFVDEMIGQVIHLALNKTSTRIIQKLISNLPDLAARPMLDELYFHLEIIKSHSMGGWLLQAMIKRSQEDALKVIEALMGDFPAMTLLETPSYTVRTALEHAPPTKRREIISYISSDKNFRLINQNQFGQHIVSFMIQLSSPDQREKIFSKLRLRPLMEPE